MLILTRLKSSEVNLKKEIMEPLNIGDLVIPHGQMPMFVIDRYEIKRFEYVEDTSNKFWEIHVDDREVTTRWGRIGNEGQSNSKTYASKEEAIKEKDKIISEKVKKGYKDKYPGQKNFCFLLKNPTKGNGESWISSSDFEAYVKKNNVRIQRKKVV